MGKYSLDLKEYARLSREAVAESCVLIKNDDNALPLKSGDKVAVLGRSAFNYYKSGLGSGGLVNTRYVITILDALRNESDIVLGLKKIHMMKDKVGEMFHGHKRKWN